MKVVLLLVCASAVWGTPRLDPLVATKKGLIRGLQASDGDYSMFMGIPYAMVNESNPFGPSIPYPDFEDIFDAFDDSAICPQKEKFQGLIVGTLDCLHLNIYVPNKATTKKPLPVLVWLYGGRFQRGFAGRYVQGPKYLVKHDVILVTVNYRVGPYGFMCLNTPEVPGNQGLKDQLSALRWVQDNIDVFGGDASMVTLMGESAGGASADFHLYSEQEKLFDKVIIQSGTTFVPWTFEEADRDAPMKIAEHLGLLTENNAEAMIILNTVEPKLVVAAAMELSLTFQPCVEEDFQGVEKFVQRHPINSAIPKVKSTRILMGYNSQEMLYTFRNNEFDSSEGSDVFKNALTLTFESSVSHDLETLVRQFYIGDEEITDEMKWELTDFLSDFYFNHPSHRTLQKYLENSGAVYHYIFSYNGGRNYNKLVHNITVGGAAHADEIGYLFDLAFVTETPSDEDQLVTDRMTTLWTNFVKFGDPTPETSDLLPVKWTPISKEILNYLDINNELSIKRRPFHARMAFWDLFFVMNRNFLKGFEPDATHK